jgi:hypothetical protein
MNHQKLLFAVLCTTGIAFTQTRPATVWIGKVTTTERSRQLYVGLNANMWLLYDLPNCVMYQAWNGGATGGTLVNASATVTPGYWFNGGPHFPHIYIPSGTNYFARDPVGEYFASYTNPAHITTYYTRWPAQPLNYQGWTVYNNGNLLAAKVRYRGFSNLNNVFRLNFGLILPNNTEISVTESPEYSNAGGNRVVRTFTFSGIPAGHDVRLGHLVGGTGTWAITSGSATVAGATTGTLTQTANGQTVLTGTW